MADFLGTPKIQYLDSNGNLLSGGKLYTYEVGTTTNKATYPTIADAKAQTNANANPVILDSRGEADVVLGGATKLVLTDSDDTTVWTIDNVGGDSDILDANGDELLVFSKATTPVNHFQIANAATGAAPKLSSVGSDTNIDLELESKGSGDIILDPGSSGDVIVQSADLSISAGNLILPTTRSIVDGGGDEYLSFVESTTPVNQVQITSADTGSGPTISSAGDDTNVPLTLDTKGTGTLTLGSQDMQVATDADTVDLQTGGSSRLDLNDSGVRLGGANSRVNAVLDEDNMSSDSATSLATQQSIKAYADSLVVGGLGSAVLLATATASSSSTIDFASGIDSTYEHYILDCIDVVPATDGVDFYVRTSNDGGVSYDSSATDYSYHVFATPFSGSASTSTGAAQIILNHASGGIGSAAGEATSFNLHLWKPSGSNVTSFTWLGVWDDSASAERYPSYGCGSRDAAEVVDGVRFLMSSGNIASGEFRLYGIKKS